MKVNFFGIWMQDQLHLRHDRYRHVTLKVLGLISQKPCEIQSLCQQTTCSKPHTAGLNGNVMDDVM